MLRRMTFKPYKTKGVNMGLTHVAVTLRNSGSEDFYTANFLVDTGAIDSLAPGSELKRMGIKPAGKRVYELANGELVEYEYAWVEFSLLDGVISSRIVFGPDDTEPLLGVLAMEAVGLVIDPVTHKLKRLEALPLKALALKSVA
jgi:predicted aspartyl protease